MLATEMRNPRTMGIDKANTAEMLQLIQNENLYAVQAVGNAIPQIEKAVDAIVAGMNNGGRLIYVGAGTSGRLGVLDAAECPPTFGVSPDLVCGIIAGGEKCMTSASEGAEDSAEAGSRDILEKKITSADCIVGISAAGGAAYVLAALEEAKRLGATTIALTSNQGSKLSKCADIVIVTETGAEAITGSTRMKAGTAQKLVLNMLSTCAMIQTGKVYENLMINLRPSNEKLRKRVISIVCEILGCDSEEAINRLDACGWSIRAAISR